MGQFMKVGGKIIKQMVKEDSLMVMVAFIMVNG